MISYATSADAVDYDEDAVGNAETADYDVYRVPTEQEDGGYVDGTDVLDGYLTVGQYASDAPVTDTTEGDADTGREGSGV